MTRENYRGQVVRAVLGTNLFQAAVIAYAAFHRPDQFPPSMPVTVILVGMILLSLVGLLDDAFGREVRGLRGHLGSLLRGRPTTGILKLVTASGLAVWFALSVGGGLVRVAGAALLVATCTNVWNALDVRPGRALKWGILVLLPITVIERKTGASVPLAAVLGGAAAVLPFDLSERAMLGDGGSNPLGFLAGAGLVLVLPPWGVLVAAAAALVLQVAAETVTISRLIDAVPPLRWFDRLGRRN